MIEFSLSNFKGTSEGIPEGIMEKSGVETSERISGNDQAEILVQDFLRRNSWRNYRNHGEIPGSISEKELSELLKELLKEIRKEFSREFSK